MTDMNKAFRFVIADNLIECRGDLSTETRNYFSDYISYSECEPDLLINISQKDIEKAKKEIAIECDASFTESEYEVSAIYEKLISFLVLQNILYVHGSVVAVDGEAFLFTANSGTGKSTHRAFWQKLLKEKVTVINDDRPLIKVFDDDCYVYGSPLSGKEHMHTNCRARLKAICLLERGTENSIERITFEEALPLYIRSVGVYKNPELDSIILDCISNIGKNVEFYRMKCLPNIEAARMAYDAMK